MLAAEWASDLIAIHVTQKRSLSTAEDTAAVRSAGGRRVFHNARLNGHATMPPAVTPPGNPHKRRM